MAAFVVAALAALAILAETRNGGHDGARAAGTVVGSLALMTIVGALLWRFRSPRAGLIAVIVVGGLVAIANLAQVGERSRTNRKIEEAIEDLGLPTDQSFQATDAEIGCLNESGFEPDDLLTALTNTGAAGSAEQQAFLDVTARCAPRALLSDTNVEVFRTDFSAAIQGEITTEEARCMLSEIVEAPVPSDLLWGSDPAPLLPIVEQCLSEETMALMRGDVGTGAQAIGDDPGLDRLAERCRTGEDVACDVLFGTTSEASDYSVLAEDCAGRGLNSPVVCTKGFVDEDASGLLDPDSPGWEAILADCRAGDMLACDFAFLTAEFDTEAERVGETCGERRAVSTGGTCVDRYGELAD